MASLVRRILDRAATRELLTAVTHSGPSYNPVPLPRRGDHVEAWLKGRRDALPKEDGLWWYLDDMLDDYRLHADTSTPLHEHCCEGGNVDDCAGCHEAKEEARA